MGWSVFGAAGAGSAVTANDFCGLGNSNQQGFGGAGANENRSQVEIRAAGTLARFATHNQTAATSYTVKVRLNAANSALSIAATTNGYYYDDQNSVALAVADLVNVQYTAVTGTTNISYTRTAFRATSGHVAIWAGSANQTTVTVGAGATGFGFPARSGNNKAAEASAKARLRVAGAITDIEMFVSANATTTGSTIISRKNGANGVLTFTVGAGATGIFKDTTHSDSVAAGDDWCISITAGATGALTYSMLAAHFANASGPQNDVFAISAAGGDTRAAGAANTFYSPYGSVTGSATETVRSVDFGFRARTSNLRLFLSANTYTGAATAVLRKNAADVTQTFAIGIGATGLFEDTTHTDDFLPTDLCVLAISGGTANNISLEWNALTMQDTGGLFPKTMVF